MNCFKIWLANHLNSNKKKFQIVDESSPHLTLDRHLQLHTTTRLYFTDHLSIFVFFYCKLTTKDLDPIGHHPLLPVLLDCSQKLQTGSGQRFVHSTKESLLSLISTAAAVRHHSQLCVAYHSFYTHTPFPPVSERVYSKASNCHSLATILLLLCHFAFIRLVIACVHCLMIATRKSQICPD